MRKFVLCWVLTSVFVGCASAEPEKPALETDDQKTLYALGIALSRQLGGAEFSDAELELIRLGLADGVRGNEPQVSLDEFGPKINELMAARVQAAAAKEKDAGQAFVDAAAEEDGARRTASGAVYLELVAGDGATPGPTDRVKIHYHGTLRDGTVFDSSVDKGTPATFAVNGVIPCFGEGLQEMKVGGKAKLTCPTEAAYGERGQPPHIRPGAAIRFEVELLEIPPAS
jgi:FKBP-type peptidyl-prolyl cis-trans isomerase